MKHILPVIIFALFLQQALPAAELLKNGDFETGDTTGWHYWETYPWDGDGIPIESPAHMTIAIPGTIGAPVPPAMSGFFALTQQVTHNRTARGGLYQEIRVVANTPYTLTGYMAFYGDDIGDTTVAGILDGSWNPALASTTTRKHSMGGNTVFSWTELSLTIIPTKESLTVFTETRQDWAHGNVAGWFDNFSLRPVAEPKIPLPPPLPENDSTNKEKQNKSREK